MDFVITEVSPPLDGLTAGVDDQWWITVELRDTNGDPVLDPNTGQPVTVQDYWWTSGAWNYYPPQAYNLATGNRYPQWKDPAGTGPLTSDARLATWEEIEPYLRAVMEPAVTAWVAQHPQT